MLQTKVKEYSCYLLLLVLVVASGSLFSCVSNEYEQGAIKPVPSEGYMKLQINMPDYRTPDAADKKAGTKAMDDIAENTIKIDQLQILVFKENANDTTFYYQAPVVDGSLQVNAVDPSKATVTIKLVKSETPDTKTFSLMMIANRDLAGITLTEGVTRKEDILQSQKYAMPATGKWNASTGSSEPFPMWGEIVGVKISEQEVAAQEIILYRALARIDVGVGFKIVDNNITEEAEGLDHFKITQVNVYRTYDKGYTTPSASIPKPGQTGYSPSIPGDAVRRADNEPLAFGPFAGANSYIREIYVPEAKLPDSPSNDNMHCIVVGGLYNGTQSYYRLDFAEDEDKDTRVYLPILRNHRYIFNILNVNGIGFDTPEDALKSSAGGSLEYEVIVWDETIHEMHVQGKYYFGLDNKEISLQAIKTSDKTTNFFDLKYQTNYPATDADGIGFVWENPADPSDPSVSPLFEAKWVEKGDKGTIRIVALTTNETNVVLSDVLQVKLGSFRIKVIVNQEYVNFKYTIDCASVVVSGTYKPGYNLDPTKHQIKLGITAEDVSINGSKYVIETEPINGIVFKAEGIFNVTATNLTVEDIILEGEGKLETPLDARTAPFTVKIVSNSSSGSYCEATITPVIAKMRILTIANNAEYGYDLAKVGSGGNKVMTSPNNFGPNDNSIVKIEGLEFIRGYVGLSILGQTATDWLQNGASVLDEDGVTRKYLADILYVGHDGLYGMSDSDAQLLMTYMKNGGVIVMFNEGAKPVNGTQQLIYAGPLRMMRALFPSATIRLSSAGTNAVIPFVGNDLYKTGTEEEWSEFMYKLQADQVLYGPFGDLRNKQWGEDASHAVAVNASAFPTKIENGQTEIIDDISIYSYVTDLKPSSPSLSKEYVTGFKYETDENASNLVSLVFFGDGGFISSNNNSTGTLHSPFWWNPTTYFPVARPNYNGSGKGVYNSQTLCNIMTWAIQRSGELYHKREAAMGR